MQQLGESDSLASFSMCNMGVVMSPSHKAHSEELLPFLQSLFVYCNQVLLGLHTLDNPASQQSSDSSCEGFLLLPSPPHSSTSSHLSPAAWTYLLTSRFSLQLLSAHSLQKAVVYTLVGSKRTTSVPAKKSFETDTIHSIVGIYFWTFAEHLLGRIK